jgi:predicted ATPase
VLTPEQQRARTLQALVDQLLGLARRQPVLVVVEDAHWIDPTTLELLELALDRLERTRALMLVTARPTFQHGFSGHPIVTRLALNRLGREPILAIIARVTGGKPLPAELQEEIVARSDGVPLFVEETTKAVLEAGLVREIEGRYRLDRPASALAIPTSLHDSLMARLDRLRPVKEVAQAAAVIGRSFDYRLLRQISPVPEMELRGALDQLVEAELIFRRGAPPEVAYTFKHALVRDAAYESLLKSRRQALHAGLVAALEQTSNAAPEILAHHATQAGLAEKAIGYWRQAGERSLRTYANQEAVRYLRQAIELNNLRPAGEERDQEELALLLSLAPATRVVVGYSVHETLQLYARTRELVSGSGSTTEQMNVIFGLWGVHFVRGEHDAATRWAEQAHALAITSDDPEAVGWASRMMGESLWVAGKFGEALPLLERCLAVVPDGAEAANPRHSADHRVTALVFFSWTLLPLGYPDQARRAADGALARAARLQNPLTTSLALMGASSLALMLRDATRAAELAHEGVVVCQEHSVATFGCWTRFNAGWADFRLGDASGIAAMRRAMSDADQSRMAFFRPLHLLYLAEVYADSGEVSEALGLLDEADDVVERTGDRVFEAELYRVRGDLLARSARAAEAEAAWQQALAIARAQKARMWELRAATSLASLWADTRRTSARGLLAPVYGWFTEGFDTADLRDAKALLDELR